MKTLTKAVSFYPLLLLPLTIIAVACLTFAITTQDAADDLVPTSNQQLDATDITEKVPPNPINNFVAEAQSAESFGSVSNAVTVFPGASPSSREGRQTSPLKPKDSRREAGVTESGQTVQPRSGPEGGASFAGDQQAQELVLSFNVASAEGPELVIPVPPGEKVPALFLDEAPRPLPQQKMLDRMAKEFNEAVANPPAGMSMEEVWEHARLDADAKYLILFGYAAYNAYHVQAAKEAVQERRAQQSAQPPTQ